MKYSEHHACTQTHQYILKSKPAIRSPFRKQKIKTINLFTNNQEIMKIISKKKVHFTHTVDHQDRSTHSKDDVHIQTRKSHSERFLTICRLREQKKKHSQIRKENRKCKTLLTDRHLTVGIDQLTGDRIPTRRHPNKMTNI